MEAGQTEENCVIPLKEKAVEILFKDRRDAGKRLAAALLSYKKPGLLVLGLPRGGTVVAYEVAKALETALDIVVVRKLGVPGQEELAMGAIAGGGVRVLNEHVVQALKIPPGVIEEAAEQETIELERREKLYRGSRFRASAAGRTVILVDDGLATGATLNAAALALREQSPAQIIAAVPVAAPDTLAEFRENRNVDEVVCLFTPEPFVSVGMWYEQFEQTTHEEVRELLRRRTEPHET